MAVENSQSALDSLRQYYDRTELVCPACGYEDTEGGWRGTTDGRRVQFEHECPSCGAVSAHTVTIDRD